MRSTVKKLDAEKTHLPFHNWCQGCVRGQGKEEACREAKRDLVVADVDAGGAGGESKKAEV